MIAGIVIDDYKLSIFERHLTQAGYTYVKGRGLTPGTLLLSITTDNTEALKAVVVAAVAEADNIGRLQ